MIATRDGVTHLVDLPDDGPWRLVYYHDRLFACSQRSGIYEVVDNTLTSIPVAETPPIFAEEFHG